MPIAQPFRPHPWHGLSYGDGFPDVVTAFIELVPTDGVKYEIDKHSGYLRVDRPQRFSSACPTLYGFVPRTYCAERVAQCAPTGVERAKTGDGDPLDVCVFTDRPIAHGEILVSARPIGGLRMVERGQADDKLLAVLVGDPTFGAIREARELPAGVVERLRHYFLTYKTMPGEAQTIEVGAPYDAEHARRVLRASHADYRHHFVDQLD